MQAMHLHEDPDACCCPQKRPGRLPAIAEVTVLAAMAGFLGYASWSGRVPMFVAPAYVWLPPAAAVLLGLMGLARLRLVLQQGGACGCDCGPAPGPARWLFSAALVAPIVAALVVDPQQFSTEGVRKRQMPAEPRDRRLDRAIGWVLGDEADVATGPAATASLSAEPTVLELSQISDTGQPADWDGRFVTVIGQCDATLDPSGRRFGLYRFVVTCCVADAQAVVVEVVSAEGIPAESRQWLRVGGILRADNGDGNGRLVIHAAAISKIPVPAAPYL